jgi:hypothetical protein
MPPPSDPQSSPPTTPRATARRLLARELGGEARVEAAEAGAVAAAGEQLVLRITGGLSRSFGPYGAVALVARALVRVRASHPLLAAVTIVATTPPDSVDRPIQITGLAAGASSSGAAAAVDALTAWLAQLADLLGGIIGDDLAATILEQSAATSARGAGTSGDTDHDTHTTVDES